jgi:hypothetical protein
MTDFSNTYTHCDIYIIFLPSAYLSGAKTFQSFRLPLKVSPVKEGTTMVKKPYQMSD